MSQELQQVWEGETSPATQDSEFKHPARCTFDD